MAVKKLTPDETAYFCEQLTLMLNAGMQLGDGLEILAEDIDDTKIRNVCVTLSKELTDGKTLAESMETSGAFPDYAVKMVRIGAVSGRLEDVLRGLTEYYENRAEMMRMIRTAVLHPLMLLVMMTVVIIVLIVLVIPMFGDIFAQFDSSVSETVQQTVDLAYSVGTGILIVLLVIIAATLIITLLSGFTSIRNALTSFAASFPLTRRISRRFSVAKVTGAMSTMISSGLSPEEALENAAMLATEKKLSETLENCRKRILEGEYFSDVIASAGIFPSIYARSLKIAYQSGSFEAAWKKISDRCNDEATQSAANFIAFIEPAIIVVLTAVIGAILLTVMIPLMNIMSVLG
jgi:type IV pilus assembly protein PilC